METMMDRLEKLKKSVRFTFPAYSISKAGSVVRVGSSFGGSFGDIDCVYENVSDGARGYPTWITFNVVGGIFEFFNSKGEKIEGGEVTIYMQGDLEHETFKAFIKGMYDVMFKEEKLR